MAYLLHLQRLDYKKLHTWAIHLCLCPSFPKENKEEYFHPFQDNTLQFLDLFEELVTS